MKHTTNTGHRRCAVVTRARDRGVNLAFFGANEIYRRIRLGSSPLGPDRIEINYRNPREDPLYGIDNALVTTYVAASGAGVLNVGTEGWSCGLPTVVMVTDRCKTTSAPAVVVRVIERATRNILQTFARVPSGRVHPARDFLTGHVSH